MPQRLTRALAHSDRQLLWSRWPTAVVSALGEWRRGRRGMEVRDAQVLGSEVREGAFP